MDRHAPNRSVLRGCYYRSLRASVACITFSQEVVVWLRRYWYRTVLPVDALEHSLHEESKLVRCLPQAWYALHHP